MPLCLFDLHENTFENVLTPHWAAYQVLGNTYCQYVGLSVAEYNISQQTANLTPINNQIATINGQITSLSNQITAINTQLTGITNRLTTVETDVSSLTTRVEALETSTGGGSGGGETTLPGEFDLGIATGVFTFFFSTVLFFYFMTKQIGVVLDMLRR